VPARRRPGGRGGRAGHPPGLLARPSVSPHPFRGDCRRDGGVRPRQCCEGPRRGGGPGGRGARAWSRAWAPFSCWERVASLRRPSSRAVWASRSTSPATTSASTAAVVCRTGGGGWRNGGGGNGRQSAVGPLGPGGGVSDTEEARPQRGSAAAEAGFHTSLEVMGGNWQPMRVRAVGNIGTGWPRCVGLDVAGFINAHRGPSKQKGTPSLE